MLQVSEGNTNLLVNICYSKGSQHNMDLFIMHMEPYTHAQPPPQHTRQSECMLILNKPCDIPDSIIICKFTVETKQRHKVVSNVSPTI